MHGEFNAQLNGKCFIMSDTIVTLSVIVADDGVLLHFVAARVRAVL